MDPKVFPNPTKFNPDRFFTSGKFTPHAQVIAFGTGKRRCPGEFLAKIELYSFFAAIVHRFTLEKDPDHLPCGINDDIFRIPKPYRVKFVARN